MEAESGTMSGLSLPSLDFSSEEKLGSSGISREPDVNFVLHKILEVPEEQIEGYLRHLGDPLEEWGMELCETCEETVVKAKRIHQEMLEAQRRFKEVKFEVISKIMSIQQGIKCMDRKSEVDIEGGDSQESVEFLDDGEFLGQDEWELEQGDESAKDNSENEDENLMEFDYHFKTEQQLSTVGVEFTKEHVPEENALKLGSNSKKSRTCSKVRSRVSKRNRTKSSKSVIPKDRNPQSSKGLTKKGNKKIPKVTKGPVKCNGKARLKNPEILFRCEICFRREPSVLVTFKRKSNLDRHIQTLHQGILSSCPRCGSRMRSDCIKKHLKSCCKNKN